MEGEVERRRDRVCAGEVEKEGGGEWWSGEVVVGEILRIERKSESERKSELCASHECVRDKCQF